MQNASTLRVKVREAYSAAAQRPKEGHAFPVGRDFAQSLGYAPELLDRLPRSCVESFAGVSNVAVFAEIPEGSTVLDLGCGAGLDSLIAAERTGPGGRVIGIDFSWSMLARASAGARGSRLGNVLFCQADAERLPLGDESIPVALVNGIFNLNPARERIFRELGRVVKRGGTVYAAELMLREPLPREQQVSESNWFA